MTKRDEAVFDKAFAKMEAKGYFSKSRAKAKAGSQAKPKSTALQAAKKTRQRAVADSVPATKSGPKAVPVAAHKR